LDKILLYFPNARHLTKVAEGVTEFSFSYGKWSIYPHTVQLPEMDQNWEAGHWMVDYDWTGVITSFPRHGFIQRLKAQGIPVVGVEHEPSSGLPLIRGDDRAIGKMAFEHLRGLGHTRFAFWGTERLSRMRLRGEGFEEEVRREGLKWVTPSRVSGYSGGDEAMQAWLSEIEAPAAVFAQYVMDARRLLVNCVRLDIAVPEEIAILGVDDDELLCRANRPTLSTIDQGCHRIGYRAAEILADWIDGKAPPPEEPVLIEPSGVRQRRSTSQAVIEDPLVSRAMEYIWQHAREGIRVSDVSDSVHCSRRTLEMQFVKIMGRTIHSEIVRARLGHARTLLAETRISLGEIAERCGYAWQGQFTRAFNESFGENPSTYRKRVWGH